VGGATVGAVSEQAVEARATFGGAARLALSARAGAVGGPGLPRTFTAAASGRADRTLLAAGRWTLGVAAALDLTHHARDPSGDGGDPLSPRLFAPALFAALSPRLSLAREAGWRGRFALDAGPALQLVSGSGPALRAGGDVRAAVEHRVRDRLRIRAELRAERVAGVYGRVEGGAALALLF
jgi:hypothetical protein